MSIRSEEARSFQTYAEAVEWITRRAPQFGIKPGLMRMQAFMEALGHPERRLKFIHVAGTNGKGSTCAYLTNVLLRSGYDVGTFTSPYLEKFTNRLRYNGRDIEEDQLLELANRVKPIADEIADSEMGPPSMFEICTTIALLYFATVTFPDYVVWETGLGGELDSTNIVLPVVSVITNVGHDHMDVLGSSLEHVAAAKAGIIKPGVPVVTGVEQPEVLDIVERTAKEKRASVYRMGKEFRFTPISTQLNRQVFDFTGPFRQVKGIPVSLNGIHQLKNAAVAMMTLEVLRQYNAVLLDEEEDGLQKAFAATEWPGRLEMVSESPRIVIDGAHNPEGAEALAEALKTSYTYGKLHFMVGMLSTKHHTAFFEHILPIADTLIVTEPDWFKKMDAAMLAEQAEKVMGNSDRKPQVVVEPDWKKALEQLKAAAGPDDLAVVTGTLYMISDVRSWLLHQSDSEKGW